MQYICCDNFNQLSTGKMENTFNYLKSECEKLGVSLSEVCRRAGVDRSVIERWKKKEPKTVQILRRLEEAITDIKTNGLKSDN